MVWKEIKTNLPLKKGQKEPNSEDFWLVTAWKNGADEIEVTSSFDDDTGHYSGFSVMHQIENDGSWDGDELFYSKSMSKAIAFAKDYVKNFEKYEGRKPDGETGAGNKSTALKNKFNKAFGGK